MQEHDDGPSDPAKVSATISAALASGLIKLPGAEALGEVKRTNRKLGVILNSMGTASLDWTRTVPHNFTPEELAALDRFHPVAREAIESAGTAPGEVMCHCSEDDGVPDVGVSVGLGNDCALWVGDLLERDGATCGVVFHGLDEKGERTRIVAPFADGTDWQEVADLFRHHVGPAIEQLVERPVIHATRPEVEILLAGRKDLMADIETRSGQLRHLMRGLTTDVQDDQLRETCRLLDRLGAYIVGQDTRLIAAGEALETERDRYDRLAKLHEENGEMLDKAQARVDELIAMTREAQAERRAAVADRDKADAAHGCAVRDYRAQLAEEVDAHRRTVASLDWVQDEFNLGRVSAAYFGTPLGEIAAILVRDLRAEIEQHKSDVRSAEKAFEEEREKRERADRLLGEQTVRMAELEIRLEGAAFALRHGMNEGVEASDAMFSPSTSLVDYLAAPLDGTKPKIPGRGLYGDETIVVGVDHLRESIRLLGRLSNDDRDDKLSAVVERLFMSAGLLPERHYKPRFRVVTSPRFYSYEQQKAAAEAFDRWSHIHGFNVRRIMRLELVELIATALGMRRAAS